MSELEARIAQLEILLKESLQRLEVAEEHILRLEIKTHVPEMSLTPMQDYERYLDRCIKVKRHREEEKDEGEGWY